MVQAFFDLLRRKGLADTDGLDRLILHDYTISQLIDLDQEFAEALPSDMAPPDSRDVAGFDFWPNSELAASLGGCEGPDCRTERFERLARFATMWADCVYVSPRFGLLTGLAEDKTRARIWLLGSIKSMLATEAALKAQIIRTGPVGHSVCPSCESVMDPSMPSIRQIMNKAKRSMCKAYFDDVRIRFRMDGRKYLLTIAGPDDLLPHGEMSLYAYLGASSVPLAWLPERVRQRAEAGDYVVYDVPKSRVNDSGALVRLISTVAEDVLHQHLACTVLDTKYLTHRPADKLFLDAINDDDSFSSWNEVLTQYLSYEMPILNGTPLEELLELRRKDYDAFLVYRDTLKLLIREHLAKRTNITGQEAVELYDDIVRPELNKMNQKLKSVQGKLSNKLAREVLVAGGVITLGLTTGVVAPAVAAIGTAAMAGKHALERLHASEEIRSENMYFLWKASQKSNRN